MKIGKGGCMEFPVEISVIMSVFNTPVVMLHEAIYSILRQSFGSFEFIIVDDGSTGDTALYLETLAEKDKRIRLLRNERNLGLTKSLNIALDAAKGKYIARMDSDDISLPMRFERQYSFMEQHPKVILCGSRVEFFGDRQGKSSGKWRRKLENMDDYRVKLLFNYPGPMHPTIFFRHEEFIKRHIHYDENLYYSQDYGLYAAVSRCGKIVILDDVLVRNRVHSLQISTSKKEQQKKCDRMIKENLLSEFMAVTSEDIDLHCFYSVYNHKAKMTPEADRWFKRILDANKKQHVYNNRKLKRQIERIRRVLTVRSFNEKMSTKEKFKLVVRYVSLSSMLKMIVEKRLGCYD